MDALKATLLTSLLLFQPSQGHTTESPDYTTFSLKELLAVEITSVSKQKQPLNSSAAAIHVITSDDIRHSSATSIPELLRHVPGLQVAKIDTNKWAISARGFNWLYANKLLVLIDGRSVYTPLFSGVWWDVQDTILEDIDRIEIIRGPGGTIWGANAVNGVINIITKSSSETTGSLTSLLVGSEESIAASRYGAQHNNLSYRVFGKYNDHDNQSHPEHPTYDDWQSGRGGFRTDYQRDDITATLQGDIYKNDLGSTIRSSGASTFHGEESKASGGNFMATFNQNLSATSTITVKGYFDRTNRSDDSYSTGLSTYDLEGQHTFKIGSRQNVIWGGGYRINRDHTVFSFPTFSIIPEKSTDQISNVFLQDEIALRPKSIHLTLGAKLENNSYTGTELQPNIRLTWRRDGTTVWSAISRAVRTPSRYEDGLSLTASGILVANGNKDLAAEKLTAYEAGLRHLFSKGSLDLALFFNDYDTLVCSETVNSVFTWVDTKKAETYGAEASARFIPMENWHLAASYSYLHIDWNINGPSSSPEHKFSLESRWNISDSVELDFQYYIIGQIDSHTIPSYNDMDIRLAWRASSNVDLELVGQNLLNPSRLEFFGDRYGDVLQATENQRAAYLKATLAF